MNAKDTLYKQAAEKAAVEYTEVKRGYKTAQEKRAFKLAEDARRAEWRASLAELDEAERRARLKAFGQFKKKVFFASILPKKRAGKLHFKPVKPENGHIFN